MDDAVVVNCWDDFSFDLDSNSEPPVKKKNKRISLEVFLKHVVEGTKNGGNSISIAKELGITPQAVRQRCHKLRNQGVPVPQW